MIVTPNKLYTSVQSPVIKKTQLFRGRQFLLCPFLLIIITFLTAAVAGEVHVWTKSTTVHKAIWMRRTHGLVPCGDETTSQLNVFHIISLAKCSVIILGNFDTGPFCR